MNRSVLIQSIKDIKARYITVFTLAALLIQTFYSHTQVKSSTSSLTTQAERILESVQSASDKLFTIKTEGEMSGGPHRSMTLKTLQSQYPDVDPLLSNVKQDELAATLQIWQASIKQALSFIEENAFKDATLKQAQEAYRDAYLFFGLTLEKYRDAVQSKGGLENAIRITDKRMRNRAMREVEKRMAHARENLHKTFGKITFNRDDKNSTRILLINVINLLNKNIFTVRKRIFELERELGIPAREQVRAQPASQSQGQRPHELPARPQEPSPKAGEVRSQEEEISGRTGKTRKYSRLSPKRQ